ncbi:hypothetical protein ABT255_02305 [Streptomyces mirabilis]|uniref:hypothetical protein n=1 Tax=Streptomyces mirabilis TaxID=68239 RepID=UPI003333BB03
MIPLTPASNWLTQRLTQHAPQLGVFLPAGFPSPGDDSAALRIFADRGAGLLEVGIPHHFSERQSVRIGGNLR